MRWALAVSGNAKTAWRATARLAALLLLLGSGAAPAYAQYERLGFDQFRHTRWTVDDGAPIGISRMAQTPDGWIWLATSEGLYRFDGAMFEQIAAPEGSRMERAPATSLLVSRTGELWVAFGAHGGVAVFRGGRLHDMGMPDPGYVASHLAQTRDGSIWVSESGGRPKLKRFAGARWEEVQDRLGLPPGGVSSMDATPDGTLWVALSSVTRDGALAYLRPGAARFQISPYRIAARTRVEVDPEGRLWLSGPDGIQHLAGAPESLMQQVRYPAIAGFSRGTLAFDAAGGLWGTTGSAGAFYIPRAASQHRSPDDEIRQFASADGLSSDTILSSLADREGSVWIGLNQFRPASALYERAIVGDPGEGYDLASAPDGTLFISSSAGVFRIAPGQAPRKIRGQPLQGMCGARDGGVWGFTPAGLTRLRGSRWETFPLPAGTQAVGACAEDRFSRTWVLLDDQRLIWRDAGGWNFPNPVLKAQWYDLIATPSGDVVFRQPGKLVRISGETRIVSDLASSEELGIWAVAASARDLFVSGSDALFRVRDGRVERLDGRRAPWATRLRGIVQSPGGDTWMIRAEGISRVSAHDLDRAFADPRASLPRAEFNRLDGVASSTQDVRFQGPQAAIGGDGRLWYLNRMGVSFIEPARLRPNRLPPPVVVRSLAAGGAVHRDPANLILPAGTRSVDIAYTALSFVAPKRVQFRYRLEGVDADWVDPGARRLASYSNLAPGAYRFQVIASNNDGVWNNTGATLQFEIRPTFFQSWLFRALCGLAVLALLWLIYSLRMRSVAEQVRLRMTERMEERERIARELHDTLLQAVQALTLRFQLAVDDLPPRARARPALEDAINRADMTIAEGRDRVRDLRLMDDRGDVEQVVREIFKQRGFGPTVALTVTTRGAPRALRPLVLDEISRIASEAIFNIQRHARATVVTIEIGYGASFGLSIADNGVGIESHIAEAGGRAGHFGLAGMRERARKLRGELAIRKGRDGGAQVLLSLPGRVAYEAGRRRFFPWPWSRDR